MEALTVVGAALCLAVIDVVGPVSVVPEKESEVETLTFGVAGSTAAPHAGLSKNVNANGLAPVSDPDAGAPLTSHPDAGATETLMLLTDTCAVGATLMPRSVHVTCPWALVATEIGSGVQERAKSCGVRAFIADSVYVEASFPFGLEGVTLMEPTPPGTADVVGER